MLALCEATSDRDITPGQVLPRSVEQFRNVGMSRKKGEYLRALAMRFESGELQNAQIIGMSEKELKTVLTQSAGIGVWTIDMLGMFRLGKPNILPVGDLEIRKEMKNLFDLNHLPSPREMESLTEHWKPYRSLGSFCLFVIGRQRKNKK